jgi:hypothetical protein
MTAVTGRRWPRALCALAISLLAAPAVRAQSTSGTLLGTVSDAGGGVLAGATVTAIERATGFTRAGRTDAAGAYRFANMPLGRYEIRVEQEGFKSKVVGPLTTAQRERIETGSSSPVVVDAGVRLDDLADHGTGHRHGLARARDRYVAPRWPADAARHHGLHPPAPHSPR